MIYNSKPQGEPIAVKVIREPQPPQEPRPVHVVQLQQEQQGPHVVHVVTGGDQGTTPQAIKGSDFPRAFYTIPQLAEELQVHENTVYRLVRAGKVEHYKVGAQIRIAAAELERLKVERKG